MNIQEHKICQLLLDTIEKSAIGGNATGLCISEYNDFLRAVDMRRHIESFNKTLPKKKAHKAR